MSAEVQVQESLLAQVLGWSQLGLGMALVWALLFLASLSLTVLALVSHFQLEKALHLEEALEKAQGPEKARVLGRLKWKG